MDRQINLVYFLLILLGLFLFFPKRMIFESGFASDKNFLFGNKLDL